MFLSPLRWPVLSEAIFLELVKDTSSLRTAFLLPHTPAWKSTFVERFPRDKNQNDENHKMRWIRCTSAIRPQQRKRVKQPLTSDARMEPPIQALNLRSRVVLLAINFKRMLCKKIYIYIIIVIVSYRS